MLYNQNKIPMKFVNRIALENFFQTISTQKKIGKCVSIKKKSTQKKKIKRKVQKLDTFLKKKGERDIKRKREQTMKNWT